ncbi:efflux RND transporter periplasmic adaptor subunit [uncultured Desulfovibrio sp.]|uniref:efflux RND transporter periplasmic adaptor subunit n=1 Tax=uncultured Desulfovibrio sp. TaxID=167968 RepID=UPI002636AB11|nr:efflux RND transporter periplasmic adaptor subunit [uncultured Desulfovibrio sp.]
MPHALHPSTAALGAVIAIILLAVFFWTRRADDAGENVLHGNVEIRQVDVGFRVGGRIAAVLVEEGESVRKGQTLARLETDLLEAEEARTRAQLAQQEATLQRLESGYRSEEIAGARADEAAAAALAENARINLHRVEAMRSGNAVSQKELDNARGTYRNAAAKQKAAREQLALVSAGYREEEILAQRAVVAATRASLQQAVIHVQDAELKAPQDGVVLTRAREAGAIVDAGQTVYTLSLVNPVWLRVYVDEPRLGRIRPGMRVEAETDAAPGRRFAGHVGYVAPAAEFTPKNVETYEVRTSLVYRIRVQVEDPDNIMRQGMPVRVFLPEAEGTPS